MESAEDLPMENLVIRHENPKKRQAKFIKRKFRYYYKGNGFLSKILVVNSTLDGYTKVINDEKTRRVTEEVKKEEEIPFWGIKYSQGKKRRWEVKNDLLTKEIAEPEEGVSSVSVIRFDTIRSSGFRIAWMADRTSQADFRGGCHKATMREVNVRTKDGETRKTGKFHPNIATHPSGSEPSIHIEYQVLDYIHNNKLHNSDKHRPYWSDWNLSCPAPVEGHILNSDVVRDAEGIWWTGDRERPAGIRRNVSSFDFSESESEDCEEGANRPKNLTLSDFMPMELPRKIPKAQKNRPRALSESWDWVPSQ